MQKILVSTFTYHLEWFQILECAFAEEASPLRSEWNWGRPAEMTSHSEFDGGVNPYIFV